MGKDIKMLVSFLAITLVLLTSGCAGNFRYTIPDVSLQGQGAEFSIDKKLDIKVNLCLSDELRATKHGDAIQLGEQLAKNSQELSEMLFESIEVTKIPIKSEVQQIDAILTPKVSVIERSLGATALSESIFTIVMEWKLEDADNNIIWVDSIKGEGRESTGNIFNHKSKMEQQIEKLLKDLFSKSFRLIKESQEIRQFAAQKDTQKGDILK